MKRIFIVGCPRSGTTLLQGLLAASPEVTSYTESHFFDFGIKRPKKSIFYYIRRNPYQLVDDFLEVNRVPLTLKSELRSRAPRYPIIPGLGVREWTNYFIYIFDRLTSTQGNSVWVEKTPDHLYRINILEKYVPNVVFIHLLRDGHDVVSSLYRASKQWGKPYTIDQCIRFWNQALSISYKRFLTKKDYFVVYEKLAVSPTSVLNNLLPHLGLNYESSIVDSFLDTIPTIVREDEIWKKDVSKPIRPRSTFKETFNTRDQQYIREHLSTQLFLSLTAKLN